MPWLERDALVESATKFYLESRIRDALEQFKEDLECLCLLPYMNRHSSLFREVFIYTEKPLLAKDIASLQSRAVPTWYQSKSNREQSHVSGGTGFWRWKGGTHTL